MVELRPVRLAGESGDRALIGEGLQPGERVVVEGVLKVRPGAKVTIAAAGAAPRRPGRSAGGRRARAVISGYFIDRPIFASVISAFIVIAGLAALRVLPVAQYPDILPPQVEVRRVLSGRQRRDASRRRWPRRSTRPSTAWTTCCTCARPARATAR